MMGWEKTKQNNTTELKIKSKQSDIKEFAIILTAASRLKVISLHLKPV